MNLINDKWILVRRKSGKTEKISPWQVTNGNKADPITELAALRPDFNGALVQFLIGLLQTTCSPDGASQWRQWLNSPPSEDALKQKFQEVAFAFNLDGNGPRFMQDLTLESELDKKHQPGPIEGLLIDSQVGEKTLNENTDFFVKRGRASNLCGGCVAQALLSLQQNSPEGGRGYVVGLRGGGPVSTIILDKTLWGTVWINVLDKSRFESLAKASLKEDKDKFPWCGETRKSENGKVTTGQDIHPAQIYWSMPCRVRLVFEQRKAECDLCGEICDQGVDEFFSAPYGVKYKGIAHPLTPTYVNSKGELLSIHQREAVGYKHWLGYVQALANEKKRTAEVVDQVLSRRVVNFRLWAFGYDVKKDKARCWYEGVMPVVTLENEEERKTYEAEIMAIIHAVDAVAWILRSSVKEALFTDSNLNFIGQRFWQETEADFYELISKLREDITAGGDGIPVKLEWHKRIVRKADQIFDEASQAEMIDEVNVKRVADAWNKMRNSLYGRKIKQVLGLPD